MVSVRKALSRLVVVGALCSLPTAAVLVPSDASASVSIAVPFDTLVKDADLVAVITAGEQSSVWEDGRIYTYTKVHVDQGVAGDIGPGAEGWVRTMGGVVGKIGQLVDGEPVFVKDKPSLLFLRKFKSGGVYEVAARAQGQYPVKVDEVSKMRKIVRSSSVGLLLPPKRLNQVTHSPPLASSVEAQSATALSATAREIRLAQDVMHDRPLEDVSREIATAWKRLHPTATK
ncbi:MAG TPA: hypothetical protein VM580_29030 [Labilithrix sp.]|nr:hypothetical protein [Labilithrix sp.]